MIANACKEDDPPLPDNLLQFEATEQGIEDTESEATIKLALSRATESAATVVIDLTANGLTYGTEFTTEPAAVNNSITVSLPTGSTQGSFKIVRKSGVFLTGSESIAFTIKSVSTPVLLGTNTSLDVKFAAIVSAGAQLTLNGIIASEPGGSAGNIVFVDFSNNQQKAVARASWDLGFYSGSEFRVVINNTTNAAAKALDKTDLNAVTAADTVPASGWAIGAFNPSEMALVDNVAGDLTQTVIAATSATDSENKVYVINPGTGGGIPARHWLKIRVLRKGTNGYTLQYARINDTTFKTLDITKDDKYNFVYVSATGGNAAVVQVEPAKSSWDIQWGYRMNQLLYMGAMVPYSTADFVSFNNRAGVQAAEVLTTTATYEAFAESHLSGIQFKSDFDLIGTNWRTASATQGASGVKTDRFYLVKDGSGNIYKLKFIRFHTDDGGTRGKPEIEYKLVKKGA